jgi:hypothetical protein
LKILDQLSLIEGLVRDIHPSSSQNLPSRTVGLSGDAQASLLRQSEEGTLPDAEHTPFPLNLDASLRSASDQILQWPVFEQLLYPLQRFQYVDFHGTEAYSYLDDLITQSDDSSSRLLSGSLWDSPAPINIATERADIERLVDKFYQRVSIKNPIISRRVASEYCEQYYENGPLFNLETCLVLLICALGSISMDYDPEAMGQDAGNTARSTTDLTNLRLGRCYFIAAEKRLGAAVSKVNTLAVQCLCLSG